MGQVGVIIGFKGVSGNFFQLVSIILIDYRLLGSAKPGHVKSSDRLAANRLMMVIYRSRMQMLNFV